MKIAVINEISSVDKNADIIEALKGLGHEIINAGMKSRDQKPELSYLETGFLGALLLKTKRADFIVGGCGTGQGFGISIMQYPGVYCGLVLDSIDAWLFAQINGGNCISLALNKGFGWAGNENLKFIFEKFFSVELGCGYPEHRREAQRKYRQELVTVSHTTHLTFPQIIERLDEKIIRSTLTFPGVWELLDVESIEDIEIREALIKIYNSIL